MTETILVISTYPPCGSLHNHPFSAVASYTKNTLTWAINARPELSFLVLADQLDAREKEYAEESIKIKRCWQRNDPQIYFTLASEILKHPKIKKVFFAFEWAMFGKKKFLLGFIPLFLIFLRLLGKKIYFISHGVLLDADLVTSQMAVTKGSLKAKIWSLGLNILYRSVVALSTKVVVFEEGLREQLLAFTKETDKLVTIPHGVEADNKPVSYEKARKELKIKENEKVIMCFGFLIWYKGSDILVKTMGEYFKKNPQSRLKLLLAGGPSKNYESDLPYQKFISQINEDTSFSKGKIEITGFIDEKDIGLYYSAADLLVFPYRVFLSSSGPLSLAFAYRKPFFLSRSLAEYAKTKDFQESLAESELKPENLIFDLGTEKFVEKIGQLEKNPESLVKIKKFSELMAQKRSWQVIGKYYAELLLK